MSFQPSINITYDIGKPDIFEQYVPNVKQLTIMETILTCLVLEQQHANIIVGPYGAGKSLVAAMLTSLLTQRTNKKEFKQFFQDVQTVAPSTAENFKNIILQKEHRWLPITITGKTGDFETIILENIEKQCKAYNIPITLKHDASYMLELITSWQTAYVDAYERFSRLLAEVNVTAESFIESLTHNEEDAVALFKEIYPQIVYGTPYYNPKKLAFIEQIDFIIQQLEKKKIALFIVFDEFGRFLQTVSHTHIYETMQSIQNLAELANRQANMGLLLITHTGLQQYSTNNRNLSKDELERVEKRFVEYRLESDSAIFYRAAYKLLAKESREESLFLSKDYVDITYFIKKYNLFASMTNEEIEGTIIAGCQPIHPLTIQLLPAISNQLGQNDRTLYMFLNHFDVLSFKDRWYYADQLFDYFYPDEAMLLTLDSMKYYRLAMKYKVSNTALRLVKMATLLTLVNTPFPITEEFMHFALGVSKENIALVFEEMIHAKLLRLNPFTKSYELYEGTLLSVETVINEVAQTHTISTGQRCKAIEQIFDERFYIPLRYNTTKSMTRFIESEFTFSMPATSAISNVRDGKLLYVLTTSVVDKNVAIEKALAHQEDDVLFGIVNIDITQFSEELDHYLLLNKILNEPELLSQDYNLKQEIEMRAETAKYTIKQCMQPIKQFQPEAISFYLEGHLMSVSSNDQFETLLDDWMFKRFPHTPEIRNESFNKTNIMGVQKKSAIQILNTILSPIFKGEFSITGNGPDYLIYATTFKNTQFNFINLDEQPNLELALLREHLLNVLQQANRNSISALFNVALAKPFGIRKPLVPLLVVALLKDKWHQMAFYAKDFSISELTAEMLYEIFENDATFYEFELYNLEQNVVNTLESLNTIYCDGQSITHPQILFKDLNKWLQNLPRFTQITEKQPSDLKAFKQIIRSSESDPIAASYAMVNLQYDAHKLQRIKDTLENFVAEFKAHIEKQTLQTFEVTSKEEIKEKYANLIQKSPQLLEIVAILESSDFIDALMLKVVGVRLADWSDITYDSYFATLEQLLIVNNDEVIQVVEGNQVINTIKEVELSVKGKTIYTQLDRIVTAGGRTMNQEEVKYILYKLLQKIK